MPILLGDVGEKVSNGGTQYYLQDRVFNSNGFSTAVTTSFMPCFLVDNFELTYSPYVNKKYKDFYDKNGYIPKMFNPYNCTEIKDAAPTLTSQGDSITKSGTVLIIDDLYENREPRVYEDYSPSLRAERSGLKVIEDINTE